MLSKREKQELLDAARSRSLREDMRRLAADRHNRLLNGTVDLDQLIEFLNAYNQFINHRPKPFKPIVDRFMKI